MSIYSLIRGGTYRVVKEFIDYDGILHTIGETWVFEKTNFLPYHSGLTLFVLQNGQEKVYRFQQIPEEQEALLSSFSTYVEMV